jgi:hypothetical protein
LAGELLRKEEARRPAAGRKLQQAKQSSWAD